MSRAFPNLDFAVVSNTELRALTKQDVQLYDLLVFSGTTLVGTCQGKSDPYVELFSAMFALANGRSIPAKASASLDTLPELVRKAYAGRVKPSKEEAPATPAKGPHEILGIRPDATLEEAQRAWQRQLQLYHPDHIAGAGPELIALANELTKKINGAFDEIKKRAELRQTVAFTSGRRT